MAALDLAGIVQDSQKAAQSMLSFVGSLAESTTLKAATATAEQPIQAVTTMSMQQQLQAVQQGVELANARMEEVVKRYFGTGEQK